MKKIFCDGCEKAGIVTDLTGRHDYANIPFLDDYSQMLDLCPERCYPIYTEFQHRIKGEMLAHREVFQKQMKEVIEMFWREVSSGGKGKAVLHTAQSGKPFWAD